MINLITYPQSIKHAQELLECSEFLIIGEERFGLRLPVYFSREQQANILDLADKYGKQVIISLNGIFHNDDIESLAEYLQFLSQFEPAALLIGDPGVIQVMREKNLKFSFIWDAGVLNTSSGNLNFWAERGAIGAVLAQELPAAELSKIMSKIKIPTLMQVYGAFALHHSGRNLLSSYFTYLEENHAPVGSVAKSLPKPELSSEQKALYIKPLATPSTKGLAKQDYAIYEDRSGTHIFAHEDLNLLPFLNEIYDMRIYNWSLNSLFVEAKNYTEIVKIFRQVADAIVEGKVLSEEECQDLSEKVCLVHPQGRKLGSGFYQLNPQDIS